MLFYYSLLDVFEMGLSTEIKIKIKTNNPADSNVVKSETLSMKAKEGRKIINKSVFLYLYDIAFIRDKSIPKITPINVKARKPPAAMPSVRNRLALAF